MTVLTAIVGILLMGAGISCILTPVATFMATGYLIGALFLVYGIAGLIKAFSRRSNILEILLSLLAIAVGVMSFTRPGTVERIDEMLLYLIAFWLVIQGLVTMMTALRIKEFKLRWIPGMIMGIITLCLGLFSLIRPLVLKVATGYMIGFYFFDMGLNMIILAFVAGGLKMELARIKEELKRDNMKQMKMRQDDPYQRDPYQQDPYQQDPYQNDTPKNTGGHIDSGF